MEIKIGSLTPQAFKGYGQVVELPQDPDKALVATEFIYFWRTSTGFCIEGGKVEIGVCTVRARDYVLTEMERHLRTSEIFIPVGKDLIFAVAPSRDLADPQDAPRPEDMEAFYLKKDQMIILNKGVWHYAPFTTKEHKEASALVFFKAETPVNDVTFAKIWNRETVVLAS